METLVNKMLEVLNNNDENAIHFYGNLDCGVEDFIGVYIDMESDAITLVTKEDVDMPIYYVMEEIDEDIINDILDVINSNDFEVVNIDELSNYTI